jgi:hypothetical protein
MKFNISQACPNIDLEYVVHRRRVPKHNGSTSCPNYNAIQLPNWRIPIFHKFDRDYILKWNFLHQVVAIEKR